MRVLVYRGTQDVWRLAWLLGPPGGSEGERTGDVEEPVVAVLHVLDHLEEQGFALAGVAFPLQRRLFPCLGLCDLTCEHVQHLSIDVQHVKIGRQGLSSSVKRVKIGRQRLSSSVKWWTSNLVSSV